MDVLDITLLRVPEIRQIKGTPMSEWDQGYVTDINYTYGYYAELNPLRIKLAFLSAGLAPPEVGVACELGFGQGLSANFHAAASVTQWYGTDFNPSQAGFAQEMARACGNGAQLLDESFEEFCRRTDLPDFDFIALHGIFSWISEDNKRFIVDFVRRKLKVGGVLYISYNTMPGWSAFAPVRYLMAEHGNVMGAAASGSLGRVNGALDFVDKLFGTNPSIVRANPQLRERFDRLKDQNRYYLAHEYFNGHWHPMHFADMAKWLEPAKLQFACSSHYFDQVDVLNMTADQLKFLNGIPDPMFRQTVRDYIVNQQFRRDYWVKGARQLTPLQQVEQLKQLRIMLVAERSGVALSVKGPLGEASLSGTIYNPILDALADNKPKSLGQIELAVEGTGLQFGQLLQAVLVLGGQGTITGVNDDATITKGRKTTEKLNAMIMSQARSGTDINYLVSPVTGGGVSVSRFPQLFLLAHTNGRKQPREWAEFVWQTISSQGQRLVKDGKPLDTAEENLAEITTQAIAFAERQLPLLRALQIARD
jgi:SAM-dependent methyltransferase